MLATQKCQYALRALLELARHQGRGPLKIATIAQQQSIPFRFLEVILSQLKQGGFVESRRGTDGGYMLSLKPSEISVGDIVEFVDGPIGHDNGRDDAREEPRDEEGRQPPDVFDEVWDHAARSLSEVLQSYTLADLLARDELLKSRFVPNYQI